MIVVWLRNWWRSPLLTGQFAITIAVGMGAASALASLTLALGYQPLPYRDPARLVAFWESLEPDGKFAGISGPDLTEFADATHSLFSAIGGFAVPSFWLVDTRGTTQVHVCDIQPNAFVDLGINPVLGRAVLPDDAPLSGGGIAPAWISYQLWQVRYGGSPSIIGAAIGIGSSPTGLSAFSLRIVGVLPAGVSIPLPFMENDTDVWYLLPRDVSNRPRQSHVFFGVGRLLPGVTAAQAQAALAVVVEHQGQRYSLEGHRRLILQSLQEIARGPARSTMGLLVLGVRLVFMVGCVNLAILMWAEGIRWRREIAICAVLGARRRRLWQEVAAGKWLLTLLSLGLGAAVAFELLRKLVWLVPPAGLGTPLPFPPPLDVGLLLSFATLALTATLIWSRLLVARTDGPRVSRALCGLPATAEETSFRDLL
jgi:putative ABC transport system permease protein